MDMNSFHYHLPEENIALFAPERGTTRLLTSSSQGEIKDRRFHELGSLLPPNAHLVFNQSKVFHARLYCTAPQEVRTKPYPQFEVMFLAPSDDDNSVAAIFNADFTASTWRVMIRKANVKPGETLLVLDPASGGLSRYTATVDEVHGEWIEEGEEDGVEATVRLGQHTSPCHTGSSLPAHTLFSQVGTVPIPPYLNRAAEAEDDAAYQTVYADPRHTGSVAAPTAGLHFTQDLLDEITNCEQGARGRQVSHVALHVGAGTFQPVTESNIARHTMHTEQFSVSRRTLLELAHSLQLGCPIIPVGTTSVRTLETLFWLGVRETTRKTTDSLGVVLGQWEPYGLQQQYEEQRKPLPTAAEALVALADSPLISANDGAELIGSTQVCLVPGYEFHMCDGLITNFHQPDSTLLLLVAALIGREHLSEIYGHAVQKGYQFLSYGDACYLQPQSK